MGMHPRWVRSDVVTSTTQRTVDRQFLFKPDPFIRNAVGASAARALKSFPVRIYWLEFNINHEQSGIAPMDNSVQSATHLVRFKQLFHRLLAAEINSFLKREGSVFSSSSRDVACVDNLSVEKQFYYALTNPVKDGLCDKVKHWGGFSSFEALGEGRTPSFTYIHRTPWHRAGGEKSGKTPEAFMKTIHLEFTPLPGTEHLTPAQRQSRIRRQVRQMEQEFREERKREGRAAMTSARMEKVDHRDRPKTRPIKTRKPLCHAASPDAARIYKEEHREFLNTYRQASARYLSGHFDVEFPRGSYRPPLIVAAA